MPVAGTRITARYRGQKILERPKYILYVQIPFFGRVCAAEVLFPPCSRPLCKSRPVVGFRSACQCGLRRAWWSKHGRQPRRDWQ